MDGNLVLVEGYGGDITHLQQTGQLSTPTARGRCLHEQTGHEHLGGVT